MPKANPKEKDPLADLDDDLGDDWESAFKSEDFMFTPEEEDNDFFLFDENDSEEDINDLTTIMDNAEQEVRQEQQQGDKQHPLDPENDSLDDAPTTKSPLSALLNKVAPLLAIFKGLPRYQRGAAMAAPCLIILAVSAFFFFRTTSEELAQNEERDIIIADVEVGPKEKPEPVVEVIQAQAPPKPLPTPPQMKKDPVIAREKTIRKQWDFPTFTIVSTTPEAETLFVNVNLSLIAILPEGGTLPEESNVLVKDIIYQFYQNRSSRELTRFALARGEMIHKLHSWLQKEWPDSPINTVIFSKYQVIRAPKSS